MLARMEQNWDRYLIPGNGSSKVCVMARTLRLFMKPFTQRPVPETLLVRAYTPVGC